MLKEEFEGYLLEAVPQKTPNGRWSAAVQIQKKNDPAGKEKTYFADDKIWYILEIEAAKESINLGKQLIQKNLAGF